MAGSVYDRKVRPSGWWYAAAAGIALGGIVAGLAVAAKGVDDALESVRSFDRTPVPGALDVTIDEPGGYSIYQEFPGASDPDGTIAPPHVVVADPAGEAVELDEYDSFVSYDQGSLEGRGIYTFRADQPGTFRIATAGAADSTITVGPGMGDVSAQAVLGVFGGVVGGAILAVGGIATSIAVAITVGVARGRSRRRQVIHIPVPLAPPGPVPVPTATAWPATPMGHPWPGTRPVTAPPAHVATARPAAPAWPSAAPGWSSGTLGGSSTTPGWSPAAPGGSVAVPGGSSRAGRVAGGSAAVPGWASSAAAGSSGTPGSSSTALGRPGTVTSIRPRPRRPARHRDGSRHARLGSIVLAGCHGRVGHSRPDHTGRPGAASARSALAGPAALVPPGARPGAPVVPVPETTTVAAGAGAGLPPAQWGSAGTPTPAPPGSAAASQPGAGTRVMASIGAAAVAPSGTGEPTLLGPAPTLVEAGQPDGTSPTEPLSRPGDPQSLRSPVDWSRSDLELPWDSERT